MRLLLTIQDSMGHLLPSIRFAQRAQGLGHEVVAVSADRHGALLDQYGIEHVPVTNAGGAFMSTWDWYVVDSVATQVRVFESMADRLRPDAVICGPLAISALIFAERQGLPVGMIGYSTYLYPALDDVDATRWWRLRSITDFYNAARTALGLRAVAADPVATPLLGDVCLLRNVPEFTGPGRLPDRVLHVGGLHVEPGAGHARARAFARHWRARGRRVMFVQIGRLFHKADLWTHLMAALDALGIAVIADTGRADYLTGGEDVPSHCLAARFVSIGDVADLVDAVICSGHGASLLGALSHRKPLVCLPTSADSVELAQRVAACGLGVQLDAEQPLERLTPALRAAFDRAAAGTFDEALRRFHDALAAWTGREEAVIAALLARLETAGTHKRSAFPVLSGWPLSGPEPSPPGYAI